MNKTIKLVSILLMVAMLLVSFTTCVSASGKTTEAGDAIDDLFENPDYNAGGIADVGGNIINLITSAGIIVAVIVLLILGIKYMIGSASEKAEYKKTMIPYLVGAVLIFGAAAIAKAVVAMAGSITGT